MSSSARPATLQALAETGAATFTQEAASALPTLVGFPGQIVLADDGSRPAIHDGVTPGGIPVATRKVPAMNRDPTSADIPAGEWTPWTNTVTGRTSVWANLNGQTIDLINKPEF